MRYTKDNIEGIVCLYSVNRDGRYDSKEYLVDNYQKYEGNRISWKIEQIIEGLNDGTFKEIRNLSNYEIY